MVFGHAPVFFFGVVDEEVYVFGDGLRLDGREVCAFDLGVREGFAHGDGPAAGAGADVDYAFGVVEGGEVVGAVEDVLEEEVLEFESFGLVGVVGEGVGFGG